MSYNVLDIANKLLCKAANCSGGELMSNLKLQKMLYYEQGYHLAKFGTPLFQEEIEAWMYGPVVPSVYEYYSKFGANGISPEKEEIGLNDALEEKLFDEVFIAYSPYSAIGLMYKTHEEKPWKTTPVKVGSVISKDKLAKFFKTRIK